MVDRSLVNRGSRKYADRLVMVAFASEEGTNQLGDHCGLVWCHFWGVVIAFVLSMRSTHKLRHHALIGGLALKPPLHGHQQAFTIVEQQPTQQKRKQW